MDGDVLVEIFDDDPAEAERVALILRQELLEIAEVDSVSAASVGPPPPDARAVAFVAVGAMVVKVIQPTVEVVGKMLQVVQDWLGRPSVRAKQMRVTVGGHSIELTATPEQQAQLVAGFLDAIAADGDQT